MWKKGGILSSRTFLLILLDILTVQVAAFMGLFIDTNVDSTAFRCMKWNRYYIICFRIPL